MDIAEGYQIDVRIRAGKRVANAKMYPDVGIITAAASKPKRNCYEERKSEKHMTSK